MKFYFLCAGIPSEIFDEVRKERTFVGGDSTEVELLPPIGAYGTPYTRQNVDRSLKALDARSKLDDKLDDPPAYGVLYVRASNEDALTDALFPSIYTCPVEWDGLVGQGKVAVSQAKNDLVRALARQATVVRAALTVLKREVKEQPQRTPWLLPVRNFRSKHLRDALSGVQIGLIEADKKFDALKDFNNQFRQNHPPHSFAGNRSYFVDESDLEFKPPGMFLHGFHHEETGESAHDLMCYVASRRRLGVPYEKTFHYDCTRGAEKPVVASLCNCHSNQAVSKKAKKNFNISPNDFTRP